MARGRQRSGVAGKHNPRAGGYVFLPEVVPPSNSQPELPMDKCADCGKSRHVHNRYPQRFKHAFTLIDRETMEARAAQLQSVEERIKRLPTPRKGR